MLLLNPVLRLWFGILDAYPVSARTPLGFGRQELENDRNMVAASPEFKSYGHFIDLSLQPGIHLHSTESGCYPLAGTRLTRKNITPATATIEGPAGISQASEPYSPETTARQPIIVATVTICPGV